MRSAVLQLVLAMGVGLVMATPVAAQDGSLRGTVRDDTGGALPGVTVTANSPALLGTREAVTDETGQYRLGNLPPGQYVLTAQLPGFSVARRENIEMRTGATFQADLVMVIGSLQETVTVAGDSPMIETELPSNVLNVRGDFQRSLPLLEGKNWVDVLEITPGVFGRVATTAPRTLYFAAAADQNDNVAEFDGLNAATVNDTTVNRISLTPEAINDTQINTGGLSASNAMGKGIIMKVTIKSGGNQFSGALGQAFMPFNWNSSNEEEGGVPNQRQVNQTDYALGGPIKTDRVWFFTAGRFQNNGMRVGRTATQMRNLQALFPGKELEDTTVTGYQPIWKLTSRLGNNHTLTGLAQYDRSTEFIAVEETLDRITVAAIGGWLVGGTITSAWGQTLTTALTVGYNNKAGNTYGSYDGRLRLEPRIQYFQSTMLQGGRLNGVGTLGWGGGTQGTNGCNSCQQIEDGTMPQIRGDLTWFKQGLGGSHEFQVGFLAYPNVKTSRVFDHNDQVLLEQRVLIDPNNPSGGSIPFTRTLITSELKETVVSSNSSNIGVYVQDVWRPVPRLTATLGLRVDRVRRFDFVQNHQTQLSTQLAPRVGASYLLTEDARNVMRGSFSRMFDNLQVGNNPMTTHGAGSVSDFRQIYDLNRDGIFETAFEDPRVTGRSAALQFAEDLRQPGIDEWIIGYRGQFPGRVAVDLSHSRRHVLDRYAQIDINGFYPDAPFKPFGGFGRIDPNLGPIYQIVNQDQQKIVYRGIDLIVSKQVSDGVNALVSIHQQWQHLDGTWNSTDPARFIQPDAFPNNRTVARTRVKDGSSYTGDGNASNWSPGQIRAALTWSAPFGVQLAANYAMLRIQKSGPILDQLAANDPNVTMFGPATVVSSTGARFSNPLATRIRFAYPTRSEGQLTLPAMHTLSLKFGKLVRLGGARQLALDLNIYNALNNQRGQNWQNNSWQQYNPLQFGQPGAAQRSRAFQAEATYRF